MLRLGVETAKAGRCGGHSRFAPNAQNELFAGSEIRQCQRKRDVYLQGILP